MKSLLKLFCLPLCLVALAGCPASKENTDPVIKDGIPAKPIIDSLLNTISPAEEGWIYNDEDGNSSPIVGQMSIENKTGGGLGIIVVGDTSGRTLCPLKESVEVFQTDKFRLTVSIRGGNNVFIQVDGDDKISVDLSLCGCMQILELPPGIGTGSRVSVRVDGTCTPTIIP